MQTQKTDVHLYQQTKRNSNLKIENMCRFFLEYQNGRERVLIGNSFDDILENYVLKTDAVSFITNMNTGVVLSGVLNGRVQ